LGLVTGDPSALTYGPAQALQVSSGVSVFPDRVYISMRVPAGAVARQLIAPQVDTICASRTSDSYVPRGARSGESLKTLPGFAVA